jgi:parallel beta-helix repeat protein
MKKLVQLILLSIVMGVTSGAHAEITKIGTDGNFQENVQEALILAEEGDVIQLPAGTFAIKSTLSLDVDNVTVIGAGIDKTILTFKNQDAGSEGLTVTSSGCTLKDFAIEDAIGDAIKVKGAKGINFLNVRTEWTNGPKSSNGAYGLYPVQSQDVLIDGCVAIGASDAGIYVGQSRNVIVRNSRAEFNVAGIEIENCYNADVYNCVATRNTGGILVFDLPNLPQQGGHDVRVFNNKSFDNDTENFAPEGNIVGNVPTGTGILIMANRNVDIFENELHGNGTTNIMVSSYMARPGEKMDPNYIPNPQAIHIHHNTFGESGYKPMGMYGQMMAAAAGTKTLPDITWDGRVSKKVRKSGNYSPNALLSVHDNGDGDFINLDIDRYLKDPSSNKPSRDVSVHSKPLPPFPGVTIESDKGTD